jgi:peptidoglycan/LPS O-acetylase OafA/YrhL
MPAATRPWTDVADGFVDRRASAHLDMARGLAALAVLVFHVRYRFFLDYSEVPSPDLAAFGWYFLTAFGHDAVMVFFVLSGFLIGSSVWRAHRARRWNAGEYAVNRLVRLSVVLLPGLLLTLLWDRAGLLWFGSSPSYTGVAQGFVHDFFDVAARSTPAVLAGNLLYLQTIIVPPFGSNDALWSLAFEGWYYVLFPLLVAVAAPGRSRLLRVAAAVSAAAIGLFVGQTIVKYFLFWLMGAALALLPPMRLLSRWPRLTVWTAAALTPAIVAAGHVGRVKAALGGSLFATDALTALAFAVCLYALLHDRRELAADGYARIASRLADCSFTLYVAHLPLLVFLRGALNPGRSWEPTPDRLLWAAAIAVGAFAYAYALSRVTEVHTPAIRRAVLRWCGLAPSVRPAWASPASDSAEPLR